MKTLIQTLLFFLLAIQVCFGQWVQVGLDGESIKDIAVQNSNIFAVTSDNGKVYRSINSGSNWTMIVDSNAVDVAISPSGKVLMIHDSLQYSENLYYSLDNGNTWITSNILEQLDSMFFYGLFLRNITVSPIGIIYCGLRSCIPPSYGCDGYFAKSTDDGLSWVLPVYNNPPGFVPLGGQLFSFNCDYVITIGEHSQGGGPPDINFSSDNGDTWALLGHSPWNSQGLGLFSNGNIIVGAEWEYYTDRVYISTDMCSTWSIIATLNSQINVGFSGSSGSEEGMLIGTEDLGVFLFSDEGNSLGSRNEGLTNLNVQALTFDNNGYVYAGTGNGVWRRPLSELIPVELTSFTATVKEGTIELNWSTATETNNQGFGIQRKSSGSEYSEIGFVPGFGTTTEPKSYSYTDSKLSAGKYTYRLKQIDFDGSFEYSAEVEVEIVAPLEFSLEQNYPNPFNPNTVISYQLPVSGEVTLNVYDILGNNIATLVNEFKPAGGYEVEFDASDLASGIYLYRIKAGEYIETKKMILLR